MPGTPMLLFGNELGMGDDLSLPERDAARTPMQWSADKNGGFSTAPREKLARPVITGGAYGYEHINVASQRRDPDSMYNWICRMIRVRKESPEFGWGACRVLKTSHEAVFVHACTWNGGTMVALYNMSREACTVDVELDELGAAPCEDALTDSPYSTAVRPDGRGILLEGFGFRWMRAKSPNAAAAARG